MIGNPEFTRNLWIQLSSTRLIAMPVILGAVVLIPLLAAGQKSPQIIETLGFGLAYALGLLWGTRVAADAVLGEVADRTWDAQRMTAVGPFQMTVGKLFGAASFIWYGVAMCLFVAVVAGLYWRLGPGGTIGVFQIRAGVGTGLLAYQVAGAALVILFGQAVALMLSLALLAAKVGRLRLDTTLCQFGGIIAAAQFGPAIVFGPELGMGEVDAVPWFGWRFEPRAFTLTVLAAYCVWSLIGVYRYMRAELQHTNAPWWLLAFILFNCALASGVLGAQISTMQDCDHGCAISVYFAVAGFTALNSAYILLLVEPKDSVRLRAWWTGLKALRLGPATTLLPRPVLCLVIAVATVVAIAMFGGDGLALFTGKRLSNSVLTTVGAAVVLFLARDILLFLYWTMDRGWRAHFAALLYLGLLYGLAPGLLFAAELGGFHALFWPDPTAPTWLLIGAPAVQLAAAALLIAHRARTTWWAQRAVGAE